MRVIRDSCQTGCRWSAKVSCFGPRKQLLRHLRVCLFSGKKKNFIPLVKGA